MAVWPSQVIFGFYFAILTLAIQALLDSTRTSTKQTVLLLLITGLCLDFVLVNIQETVKSVDASYGLVVLWDAATFFAWLRAVSLCNSTKQTEFFGSLIVAMVPAFALGREVLFLPYTPFSWRAYLDLLFGNLTVSIWVLLSLEHPWRNERTARALTGVVLIGCAYWFINAIENIALLAWSPLAPALNRALARAHLPTAFISIAYAFFATILVLAISRWNPRSFGTRLGIAGKETAR